MYTFSMRMGFGSHREAGRNPADPNRHQPLVAQPAHLGAPRPRPVRGQRRAIPLRRGGAQRPRAGRPLRAAGAASGGQVRGNQAHDRSAVGQQHGRPALRAACCDRRLARCGPWPTCGRRQPADAGRTPLLVHRRNHRHRRRLAGAHQVAARQRRTLPPRHRGGDGIVRGGPHGGRQGPGRAARPRSGVQPLPAADGLSHIRPIR